MRRIVHAVSPAVALAVVWVSVQSLLAVGAAEPAPAVPAPATAPSPPAPATAGLIPELGSVSQLIAATADSTDAATVPASIRNLLTARGTVLLVAEEPGNGGEL